jgi:hypothetical protein
VAGEARAADSEQASPALSSRCRRPMRSSHCGRDPLVASTTRSWSKGTDDHCAHRAGGAAGGFEAFPQPAGSAAYGDGEPGRKSETLYPFVWALGAVAGRRRACAWHTGGAPVAGANQIEGTIQDTEATMLSLLPEGVAPISESKAGWVAGMSGLGARRRVAAR